ncbi:hypothetical protein LTR36_003099 [Oleoguttula mirabilis]|uniref:Uncharacterized protein n=1 Tax=Oleoguttula mirabilis TaxID=1507867 RepID=A0AAV9JWK6_9PEZI|nr:hypothetical protein LTR36_003099 [Oleoguttula mirabilis]
MLSKRSLTSLSSAERQLLRQQWLGSGKCARCFHASMRRKAEEGVLDGSGQRNESAEQGNDGGTPYNKPQRGPSRHQRAAMISEEVRMLNRETPALGPSKPPNDGADLETPPASVGQGPPPPGRMGENMSPEREGPQAQGLRAPARSMDDDDVDGRASNSQVRGDSAFGDAGEGGLLGGQSRREEASINVKQAEAPEAEDQEHAHMTTRRTPGPTAGPRLPLPGVPFMPASPVMDELIGNNAATIAAANFEGVLNDRIKTIAEPGQLPDASNRSIHNMAQKLLSRQIIRFTDAEEKKAVIAECRRITGRGAKMTDQERAAKGPDNHPYFEPLPESVRKSLVDKMVNGVYDTDGLLEGKQKHKQPILNEIARLTLRNGTYLSKDSDRLLRKVQSLLPAMQATRQQATK